MKIRLRLFATLARYLPADADGDGVTLALVPGATLADALAPFQIPDDEQYVAVVNGIHADSDAPLADGDEVTLFPPLSGGSTA